VTEISGEKFNFYSSFGWARDFHNYNFKLGVATVFKEFNTDNRIRITSERNAALYHKTSIKHNDVRFGFIGVIDLTKQLLLKKDLLFGYRFKQWDVILKAEQDFKKPTGDFSKPKEWFSSLSLTTTYTHNSKQKYSVLLQADPAQQKLAAVGLFEYKHTDKSFTKISVDSAPTLTVLIKNTISHLWSLSLGVQVPLVSGKDAKTKFGAQVDLNI